MSRAKVRPGDRIEVTAPSVLFVGERALVTHVNEDQPRGTNTRVKVAPEGSGYQHPATADQSWNYGHLHFKRVPNEPSNDDIPADEMLLAEAIAEAKGRGLKWCKGTPFDLGRAFRHAMKDDEPEPQV